MVASFFLRSWISSQFLFLNPFINISEPNVKTKERSFSRDQSWCLWYWALLIVFGSLIVFLLNLSKNVCFETFNSCFSSYFY